KSGETTPLQPPPASATAQTSSPARNTPSECRGTPVLGLAPPSRRTSHLPRLTRVGFPRASRHHRHAASARIARTDQLAIAALHRLYATEEEVQIVKAHDFAPGREVVAGTGGRETFALRLDLLEIGASWLDSRLVVDNPALKVRARSLHRLGYAQSAVHHPHDRLQQRRADPVGAGAAKHELHLSLAHHDRRSHHARHARSGRMAVKAKRTEILLTHHIVQVYARAGYHHARALPIGARHRARTPMRVKHRDMGGGSQPRGQEARQESLL